MVCLAVSPGEAITLFWKFWFVGKPVGLANVCNAGLHFKIFLCSFQSIVNSNYFQFLTIPIQFLYYQCVFAPLVHNG
jgi:hypothetical protein